MEPEEPPVAFLSADPPSESTIEHDTNIHVSFSGRPVDLNVSDGTLGSTDSRITKWLV